MTRDRIAAIVLAAGRASRFGAGADGVTKLVALDGGAPLVRRVVEAARDAGLEPVIVVTGHARAQVLEALAGLEILEAYNARFADGIAGSLGVGLGATSADCDGALVLLGDMPRVTPSLARRLVDAFRASPQADAVAPMRAGARGNPVLLARALFAPARALEGDEGARRLLRRADVNVVDVDVDDEGAFVDVDTREALARLNAGDEI